MYHSKSTPADNELTSIHFKDCIENYHSRYKYLQLELFKILSEADELRHNSLEESVNFLAKKEAAILTIDRANLLQAIKNYRLRNIIDNGAIDQFDNEDINIECLGYTNPQLDQFYGDGEYIEPVGLNFIVTDKCNITCALCGPGCGPNISGSLNAHDMIAVINKAAIRFNLKHITFTGGEPTLFIRDICHSAKHAASLGCETIRVVTNGAFGRTEKTADAVLARLKDAGVTELAVSVDDFHLVYVPAEDIKRTVLAAVKLNLPVNLSHKSIKGSVTNLLFFKNLIGLPIYDKSLIPENISRSGIITFSTGETQLIGRGKETYETNCSPNRTLWDGPCSEILKRVTVSPGGEFMPCCNIVDRGIGVFYKGNAVEFFDDCIENADQTVLYAWLALEGPSSILRDINESNIEFTGQCEACQHIFVSIDYRDRIKSAIHIAAERLFVKKCLYSAYKIFNRKYACT